MPAHSKRCNWLSMITRLLGVGCRRQGPRRRAGLHDFMHMSDRMLADIGVRRADVHAAISGLMPPQHIARTRGGAPWTAEVHRLRPRCRQAPEATAEKKPRRRRVSAAANAAGQTNGFLPARTRTRSGTPGRSNASRRLLVR